MIDRYVTEKNGNYVDNYILRAFSDVLNVYSIGIIISEFMTKTDSTFV